MLRRFMVKNFLSFRDETTLDLRAINSYKEHKRNFVETEFTDKILKVASIYGANASGKSNLFSAMNVFRQIVMQSMDAVEKDEAFAIQEFYVPFSFEEDEDSTIFEIEILVNENEYTYGFEYNDEKVVGEWLYRLNKKTNRTSIILERFGDIIGFGASVRKECEIFSDIIPYQALVLSFLGKLTKLKAVEFSELYNVIKDKLIFPESVLEANEMIKILPAVIDKEKPKLIEFLKAIDSGIRDIGYEETEKGKRIITYHLGVDNKLHELNIYNESEGTLKAIGIFIISRIAVFSEGIVIVDELNSKLHPWLLKFIIDLFYETDKKAQLIYTTHDTTLLDKKFFRRDQIWFVEKDDMGYSTLTALSDYKVRSDASFEKDYLAGVYGGIPLLKEFDIDD